MRLILILSNLRFFPINFTLEFELAVPSMLEVQVTTGHTQSSPTVSSCDTCLGGDPLTFTTGLIYVLPRGVPVAIQLFINSVKESKVAINLLKVQKQCGNV